MKSRNICAGIVLYNPDMNLLSQNLKIVFSQIEKIYLFDNGSKNSDLIREMIQLQFKNVKYIYSDKNMGIAFGINSIFKEAFNDSYKWCLTLDQDSICSSNMIKEYLKYINYKNVALICPYVLNNGKISLSEYKKLRLPQFTYIKDPMKCITSGSLTNISVFESLKGVNNNLFIDFVDTELNCKILNSGYKILRANKAYLIQHMGEGHEILLFKFLYNITHYDIFRKLKVVAVYPSFRLYYMARNSKYIHTKYSNSGVRTSKVFMILYFVYCLIFYPKNISRINMLRSIISGFNNCVN